jgi:2-polyprenyl-3-methyl-5-hydroxy-6-metoxy-1,4-benzoquinol methylase
VPTALSNAPAFSDVAGRARCSGGTSGDAIYRAVATALLSRHAGGGLLLDVGCGTGSLWPYVADCFDRYLGADVLRHDAYPAYLPFCAVDLDHQRVPMPDGFADVVAAVETIEHLENPRAFVRELVRLTRPGGWVVVTTPNQLSLLSKLTLVVKNRFNAFQEGSYPAHLTALLEVDLRRIAGESRLTDVAVHYSRRGRMPGLPWYYPAVLSRAWPRACSDNVVVVGRCPNRVESFKV